MEQSPQQPQPLMGVVTCAAQTAYADPYQSAMVTGDPAVMGAIPPSMQQTPTFSTDLQQLAYQQMQQLRQQQLQTFWATQMLEIEQTTDFKNHSLPLARVKKIMKSDEDVKMISAEAPVIFSKACELFIQEMTLRSWMHTEENRRKTLQRNDITATITRTDMFDFLVDIIPRNEPRQEGSGNVTAALPAIGVPSGTMPNSSVEPQHLATSTGMIIGNPVDPTTGMIIGNPVDPTTGTGMIIGNPVDPTTTEAM